MIKLIIYGQPVAQGRPRFSTAGGHIKAYDPAKSRDFKQYIKLVASQNRPEKLLEGPLQMDIQVFKETLKSFSKKKATLAEEGKIRPITKPDADNLGKLVMDSLKSVVWKDDSQVVDLHISKWYSATPRIEITIDELE
jgi:Holliday junction resolvase RusA-like endonuclease